MRLLLAFAFAFAFAPPADAQTLPATLQADPPMRSLSPLGTAGLARCCATPNPKETDDGTEGRRR